MFNLIKQNYRKLNRDERRTFSLVLFLDLMFALVIGDLLVDLWVIEKVPLSDLFGYSFFFLLMLVCVVLLLFAGTKIALRATLFSVMLATTIGVFLGPIVHNEELYLTSMILMYLLISGTFFLVILSSYSLFLITVINFRRYRSGSFDLDVFIDILFVFFIFSGVAIYLKSSFDSHLREKNTLLKELHHRTKNSMQFVAGYLYHLKKILKDKNLENAFTDLEMRIRGIAFVHQKLYSAGSFSHVYMNEYIPELVRLVLNNYILPDQSVKTTFELATVLADYDTAVICGIVINELISNSCKHAFTPEREGLIFISLKKISKTMLQILVKDNGGGITEDVNQLRNKSTGMKTMFDIVEKQLKGDISFSNEGGLVCRITFRGR